jgi:murein DD-endopeptidase MepM/ murein hydrolase activator NlpD
VYAAPAPQVIVVSPGDISTPTPTPLTGFSPTPTPQPANEPTVARTVSLQERQFVTYTLAYTVKPGDTLWRIALEIGMDLEDVYCAIAPDFSREQPLVIGDVLEILPPGFACHEVQVGETLETIAGRYGVAPEAIEQIAWNRLAEQPLAALRLTPGRHLRIPPAPNGQATDDGFLPWILSQPVGAAPFGAYGVGGPKRVPAAAPVPDNWPYGSGHFTWPVYGWLSQGYHYDHRALDIAAPSGSFATAADRGVVVRAGWNDQGYGLFVIIDHNIDYVTLYAHLSEIFVQEGDVVAQGEVIGAIGSTGNSTGPHLHFEIRDFGRRVNPLEFLLR